jgi:hypothetical protein
LTDKTSTDSSENEGGIDIKLETLSDPNVFTWLGLMTAALLERTGSAGWIVQSDGFVTAVNPAHMFFDPEAATPQPGRPIRKRPVLMDARPKFVEIDENGTIWEIEFKQEEK